MKRILTLLLAACAAAAAAGSPPRPQEQPRLVVLIVLDQFPYDYMTRFGPSFGSKGIARIMSGGASFANARYGHAFTKTAPGHACISTGAYPRMHGIIANRWYERGKGAIVNCVDDDSTSILGNGAVGRSPRTLRTYTIGDMLRLRTNFRSKVFGLSNKDRAAILMAGKLGTAYWMEDSIVVTSNYYMPGLPSYVAAFNRSDAFRRYYGATWTETRPSAAALLCDRDDAPYEAGDDGLGRAFPHVVDGGKKGGITPSYYAALQHSPFSTEILLKLAEATCDAETLGRRGVTDMLCVGISATDEIGHIYGPASHEVFDNALRTDSLIAGFLSFLDRRVGLSNCLIALSSDHGIAPVPEYIHAHDPAAPAGRVSSKELRDLSEKALATAYGPPPAGAWISEVVESELYLNRENLSRRGIAADSALGILKRALRAHGAVAEVFSDADLAGSQNPIAARVAASTFPARSGDLHVVLRPYFIFGADPANHGQPYDYDAHVPVILWGVPFKQGVYRREVSPADIAPTLAMVLGIEFPPSREGRVLEEALK